MNKYLYKIKDLEIPTHLKYWFARKSKVNFDLSQILNGTSFDLTNTVNKKLHLIDIFGNSIQNGEPTPENPIEIKSSGDNGSITEKIININCFNSNTVTLGKAINSSGKIINNSNFMISDFILVNKNETDTLSFLPKTSLEQTTRVHFYGENKIWISQTSNVSTSESRIALNTTTPSNCKYVRISIYKYYEEIMFCKGIGTIYQPHQEQTYTIPCQQPMRAIGNVKDTFVKIDGVWYERHYINRLVLRGTQNWWSSTSQVVDRYYMNLSDGKTLDDYHYQVSYCNYYHYDYNAREVGAFYLGQYQDGTRVYMNYAEKDTSTKQAFKDFLEEKFAQGKPAYIDYALKEPLDLPCTQEQIEALENLQKARTYKDVTHIYTDDEVPADLEIQYYKEKGE